MKAEKIGAPPFSDERWSGRLCNFIIARPALTIAIIVSVIGVFGILYARLMKGFANDFGVYWRTANGPLDAVYSYDFEFPFPYAPTMLLWISPLKLIPFWPAFAAWNGFSLWALARACRPHMARKEVLLTLATPAVAFCIMTGQVSAAMGALIIWACSSGNRVAAGIAFGIVASIKPQLVIMAPLLLLFRRDWRAIAAAGATFLLLAILSAAIFGTATWWDWAGSLIDFRHRLTESNIIGDAATPASVAEWFGLPARLFMGAGAVAGGLLVWHCRNREPLETATAIGAASLLAAPYALPYDLVILSPLLVMAVFRGRFTGLGLANIFQPLPLVLAAATLWKRDNRQTAIWPGGEPAYEKI